MTVEIVTVEIVKVEIGKVEIVRVEIGLLTGPRASQSAHPEVRPP